MSRQLKQVLLVSSVVLVAMGISIGCGPVDTQAPAGVSVRLDPADVARAADGVWPSFRGLRGSGVAVASGLPESWDATSGANLAWRTAVPGLGHSSPTVWGDRLFVTTAVDCAGESVLGFDRTPSAPCP